MWFWNKQFWDIGNEAEIHLLEYEKFSGSWRGIWDSLVWSWSWNSSLGTSHTQSRSCPSLSFSSPSLPPSPGPPPPPLHQHVGGGGRPGESGGYGDEKLRLGQDLDGVWEVLWYQWGVSASGPWLLKLKFVFGTMTHGPEEDFQLLDHDYWSWNSSSGPWLMVPKRRFSFWTMTTEAEIPWLMVPNRSFSFWARTTAAEIPLRDPELQKDNKILQPQIRGKQFRQKMSL